MRQLYFLLIFMSFSLAAHAQRPIALGGESSRPEQLDSLQIPPITAYKIISVRGDTTYVDTSLTIQKYYKFNYLRRDNFGLLPFANIGQTYNTLAYNFKGEALIPEFGARARHFNFMEAHDIRYYDVATPLTELYYRTVAEQGQTLDAFFTTNTSRRLNLSIAYKGLRSLGKYQNSLASTGNFRSTLTYSTLNNRYRVNAHFVAQDLLNRESGGLDQLAIEQFISKEEDFEDRALLEVKFENAENILFGKRFYVNQEYDLLPASNNRVSLRHILDFSDKKYVYRQTQPHPYLGVALRAENINDEIKLRHINNTAALAYENPLLGSLAVKGGHSYYNYGYNSILFIEGQAVSNRLSGQNFSGGAQYSNAYGPISVYGDAMLNVAGDFSGHFLTAGMQYRLTPANILNVEINSNERAPNFNYLLYQSDYLNYNWQNNFSNQSSRILTARLTSPVVANIEASITQIDNFTFFTRSEAGGVRPFQYGGTVNYMQLKAQREFRYGRFALDNTVMYQNVTEGGNVFNVPEVIARSTIYYGDHWFQRALQVQTGFSVNYFTPYNMDRYDPLLAEFYVQNDAEFGGYPIVDFFFNGRVRQTRVFFKLEHINSLLLGNNNFSAPDYPYRDFLVRFGLVWNFFM